MIAPAFAAAIAAFLLFGLATDHHRKRIGYPCPKQRARALRIAAWACLALGFAASLLGWGPVFGPIGWAGTVMAGAAVAFCGLNLAPPRAAVRPSGSSAASP